MVDRRKQRSDSARHEVSAVRTLATFLAGFVGVTGSACGDATGPGSGDQIVFDWVRDGNREIYRASLDGRDTVRITSNPGDDQHPSSARGTIVFTSFRDGNGELYAVKSDGTDLRQLTHTTENETEPALSSDGTRLAYVSDESDAPKLWVSSADGSDARAVAADFGFAGSAEVSPSWSPSGDRLVFVSTARGSADLY